ncbi:hypothetical protein ACSFBX_30680 [Variovorax sp. RB2P76]|uniref:hypothetical protein n=1 Tax=Variovorax sp. RB2P76 TaxID=3443736 RepID=UPI003F48D7C8
MESDYAIEISYKRCNGEEHCQRSEHLRVRCPTRVQANKRGAEQRQGDSGIHAHLHRPAGIYFLCYQAMKRHQRAIHIAMPAQQADNLDDGHRAYNGRNADAETAAAPRTYAQDCGS